MPYVCLSMPLFLQILFLARSKLLNFHSPIDKSYDSKNENMHRKSLSVSPCTSKCHALEPSVSQEIEPDIYFEYWTVMVPDNEKTHITIKRNFSHTFLS